MMLQTFQLFVSLSRRAYLTFLKHIDTFKYGKLILEKFIISVHFSLGRDEKVIKKDVDRRPVEKLSLVDVDH